MEEILLKGGKIHYTIAEHASFRVDKGSVLVYLIPVLNQKDGRRLLLAECEEGKLIPNFYHKSELLGEWRFGFVAMDSATMTKLDEDVSDEVKMAFAKEAGVKIFDPSEFDEMVIEKYELVSVKDKGYLYAAIREKERTKDKSLRLIYNLFNKTRGEKRSAAKMETGKALYDATAYICDKMRINVASVDRVVETSGRRYTIDDIARVSHFVIRSIVLEQGWHHKDTGAILAFRKSDNQPVACVPKSPNSYIIYDPKTGTSTKLTNALAEDITPNAYMFYRPFPEKPMKRLDLLLFGIQSVYVSDIVRLFLLTLLGTLVGLLIPYMNEQAYDKFIPMGNSSGLIQIGCVLLACSLGNISFTIVKNLASFRSMNSMEYAVQSATFDRLFNLPESFYRDYDSANLGQRAMGITTIYNVLASSVLTSVLSAIFSIMYLWRMFKYSSKMSLWALLLLLGVSVFIFIMGTIQIKYERQMQEIGLETQSVSFQMLSGVSKIRNAFAEDRALLKYLEKSVKAREIYKTKERFTMLTNAIVGSIDIIFSVIFYYLMIRQDIGLSIGAFSGFTAAFGAFSGSILTIVQNFLVVNHIKPVYEYAQPILETLPETNEEADLPGDIKGEIDINNVTFSYNPDEPPVLQNLNLHIKPGEYIGIVGSSGCGKSTLLKLLLGFERPQVGRVYYDNRDIDELDKRELRKKFGVVLQDGGMISGSIYENIVIASPGTKMKRVEQVVKEVGLDEDIKAMPMGLHTVISDGAGTISGGQAQRILIARAIVGKPKVIFLDEATSALDNVTQGQIVETLEKLNATKVVIAHRLSTVQNCDRIIVFDKGNIVEEGNYEQLMEQKGLFYKLAMRQIS